MYTHKPWPPVIDFWLGLPQWLRFTLAILLLGISTYLYFEGTNWPWGWVLGAIFFAFAFMTDEEADQV